MRVAEDAASRLVRARVVRDVGAGPRERLRTGAAGIEDKDVHRAGVYSLPAATAGAPGGERMSRDHTKTVQIRRIAKVAPDHRGRSVWLGKIEPVELELVSTTALKKILQTEGGRTRSEIAKLAAGRKNGVLARDAATGHFRILSEADLRKAVDAPPGRSEEHTSEL